MSVVVLAAVCVVRVVVRIRSPADAAMTRAAIVPVNKRFMTLL